VADPHPPVSPTCSHCQCGSLAGAGYPRDFVCRNGVAIDVDVWSEGWSRDSVYPLAPCHPGFCGTCRGGAELPDGDCETCGGTGNALGDNDSLARLRAARLTWAAEAERERRREKRLRHGARRCRPAQGQLRAAAVRRRARRHAGVNA